MRPDAPRGRERRHARADELLLPRPGLVGRPFAVSLQAAARGGGRVPVRRGDVAQRPALPRRPFGRDDPVAGLPPLPLCQVAHGREGQDEVRPAAARRCPERAAARGRSPGRRQRRCLRVYVPDGL